MSLCGVGLVLLSRAGGTGAGLFFLLKTGFGLPWGGLCSSMLLLDCERLMLDEFSISSLASSIVAGVVPYVKPLDKFVDVLSCSDGLAHVTKKSISETKQTSLV